MSNYRGYQIQVACDGTALIVTVHPLKPDLPISGQFSFRPLSASRRAAVDEAKHRVDLLLSGG
jgi:hypothetical protein